LGGSDKKKPKGGLDMDDGDKKPEQRIDIEEDIQMLKVKEEPKKKKEEPKKEKIDIFNDPLLPEEPV
jgi:hypothetical protein